MSNRPGGPSEKQPSKATHCRQLDRQRGVSERTSEKQQVERPHIVVQLELWAKTANSSGHLSLSWANNRPRIVENYPPRSTVHTSFRTSRGLISARASPVPELRRVDHNREKCERRICREMVLCDTVCASLEKFRRSQELQNTLGLKRTKTLPFFVLSFGRARLTRRVAC